LIPQEGVPGDLLLSKGPGINMHIRLLLFQQEGLNSVNRQQAELETVYPV
jgi:hypothetical protein